MISLSSCDTVVAPWEDVLKSWMIRGVVDQFNRVTSVESTDA